MRSFLFATLTACTLLLCPTTLLAQQEVLWLERDGVYKTDVASVPAASPELVYPLMYQPQIARSSYLEDTDEVIWADERHILRAERGSLDLDIIAHSDTLTFHLVLVTDSEVYAEARSTETGRLFLARASASGGNLSVLRELPSGALGVQVAPSFDQVTWTKLGSTPDGASGLVGIYGGGMMSGGVTTISPDILKTVPELDPATGDLAWGTADRVKLRSQSGTTTSVPVLASAQHVAPVNGEPVWVSEDGADLVYHRLSGAGNDSTLFVAPGPGAQADYFVVDDGEILYVTGDTVRSYSLSSGQSRTLMTLDPFFLQNRLEHVYPDAGLAIVLEVRTAAFSPIRRFLAERTFSAGAETSASDDLIPQRIATVLRYDPISERIVLSHPVVTSGGINPSYGGELYSINLDGKGLVAVDEGQPETFTLSGSSVQMTGNRQIGSVDYYNAWGSVEQAGLTEHPFAYDGYYLSPLDSTVWGRNQNTQATVRYSFETGQESVVSQTVSSSFPVVDERRQELLLANMQGGILALNIVDMRTGSVTPTSVQINDPSALDVDGSNNQIVYADAVGLWISDKEGTNATRIREANGIAGAAFITSPTLWIAGSLGLEGLNTGGAMATGRAVPASQPFNAAPWSYAGTETVSSVPAEAVAWVLLSLTPAGGGATTRRAVLVRADGTLLDMEGAPAAEFAGLAPGTYTVRAQALGHAAVETTADLSNGVHWLDAPMLLAGDGNGDGVIDALDGIACATSTAAACDFDANGTADQADLLQFWLPNNGR
ncbi:MAG: hypothetical protein AAGI08_11020 [Bacteroidota bacterium]